MNIQSILKLLLVTALTVLSTACLVRHTVTQNGQVVKSNYKVKHP